MNRKILFFKLSSHVFILVMCMFIISCYEEELMVSPSDQLNAKDFGCAVDVCDDFALAGDKFARRGDGSTMYNVGSVHFYQNNNSIWTEVQKFQATDPTENAEFGHSVAMNGAFAIVGSPKAVNNGTKSGAVYILRRWGNSWYMIQKIASPFNELNCYFGESVDIYGNYAIVGAPLADTSNGSNTGAAAIYRFNGYYWQLYGILDGNDSAYGDWFGLSVKINANYAVVGAPYDDTQRGSNGGSAYVFSASGGWIQRDKLVPSGSYAYARAGLSVSLTDDYVILGAPYENNEKGRGAGAVYFFENHNGICDQVYRFVPPYSGVQYFGYNVDIIDTVAVVGAPQSYNGAGLVYVYCFVSGSWSYMEELRGSQAVSADNPKFGSSTSLYGEYAFFGAPGHKNVNGYETGAAYIFKQNQ